MQIVFLVGLVWQVAEKIGGIGGFAEALASIAEHLGFVAEVVSPDEAGFREAREKGFDLCIWADDDTYLAEAFATGVKAENGAATGIGFAEALLGHAGKTSGSRRVLVLGAGPVGRAGAARFRAAGWEVFLCDIERSKAEKACREHPALSGVTPCSPEGLRGFSEPFSFLLDAAPTSDCMPVDSLEDGAAVSAPCVPCPWFDVDKVELWHDPLQLGTAVMLLGAAFRDSDI